MDSEYFDRPFLLEGIKRGFDIIDPECIPTAVEDPYHPSVTPNSPLYREDTTQVQTEIDNGNYIPAVQRRSIVSPLRVISKSDGGVRLIHDCSRPEGRAVNNYAHEFEKQKFQTLDDARALVSRGCFMAKVDLKSAYRSVKISEHSQNVTGLKWVLNGKSQYFYDYKLPLGSKLAPDIFHRLPQAVRHMMTKRGYTLVAYCTLMISFYATKLTGDASQQAMLVLIRFLRRLGFEISWHKVAGPSQTITSLCIEIDAGVMQLRLPGEKLEYLRQELSPFSARKRVSKRQLQSLAGKLKWAAMAVFGGRVFLRRIINAI